MSEHTLLCLKCRLEGHSVDGCPQPAWSPELEWFFSPIRMSINFNPVWSTREGYICDRCETLILLSLASRLPPWNTQSELTQELDNGSRSILSLGKVGSMPFWTDCHVCRCLFAIIPNPNTSDQDTVLFSDWTMCRLSGENGVAMDIAEKRNYAACLVATL